MASPYKAVWFVPLKRIRRGDDDMPILEGPHFLLTFATFPGHIDVAGHALVTGPPMLDVEFSLAIGPHDGEPARNFDGAVRQLKPCALGTGALAIEFPPVKLSFADEDPMDFMLLADGKVIARVPLIVQRAERNSRPS